MTKEVIIITLIILVIYLYYQQNNQSNISDNNQQIRELQSQVNHYQTLYQKRVAKDLESDQSKKINQLTTDYAKLSAKHTKTLKDKAELEKNYQDHLKSTKEEIAGWKQEQANLVANLSSETHTKKLYSQKIESLETQLLNLAKQKIKNQKQAKELLNQLESNWKQEKNNLLNTLQTKEQKIKEMVAWSQGEHNRILELEAKEKAWKSSQEKVELEKKQLVEQLKTNLKQVEQERNNFKEELNAILNKWNWAGEYVKTSEEFISKMEPFIRKRSEEMEELKKLYEKQGINNLKELEEQLENKEKSLKLAQEKIKELEERERESQPKKLIVKEKITKTKPH